MGMARRMGMVRTRTPPMGTKASAAATQTATAVTRSILSSGVRSLACAKSVWFSCSMRLEALGLLVTYTSRNYVPIRPMEDATRALRRYR